MVAADTGTEGAPTAAAIHLSRTAATALARIVTEDLTAGRMGVARAERAVLLLDGSGYFEVASGVRLAVATRRAVLAGRGFTARRSP